MTKKFGDIDIDVANREQFLSLFNCTKASQLSSNNITPHNTGVFLQNVPVDPITNLCSIDYSKTEKFGYFKIDVLNVSLYQQIPNKEHLNKLLELDLDWAVFENKEFVKKLYHLHNHSELVAKLKPKSIEDLAAVLAIIRPAKRYLENYSWDDIRKNVWVKEENSKYFFKKSHAISYAMMIYAQAQNILQQDGEIS